MSKKTIKRIVDSSLSTKESKESAERTKAELKKVDPDEAGAVIAKLLDKEQS